MEVEGAAEVEADRHLLVFKCYDDYLNSLVTPVDLNYLRSALVARQVAQLGYRCRGETLTREAFERRVSAANELLHPRRQHERVSGILAPSVTDPVLIELSHREKQNRMGQLHTIIFVRVVTRLGAEVSGYIDYAHRLRHESWTPVFQGKRTLRPNTTDLGYYNWRTGHSTCNSSDNYKIILDPVRGLLFQNVWDHIVLSVDPNLVTPGPSSTRTRITSPKFLSIILYDHKVRRKC